MIPFLKLTYLFGLSLGVFCGMSGRRVDAKSGNNRSRSDQQFVFDLQFLNSQSS